MLKTFATRLPFSTVASRSMSPSVLARLTTCALARRRAFQIGFKSFTVRSSVVKPANLTVMTSKSGRFVALLRGINVGGKNMLPMKDLCTMFEEAGCAAPRHYIQSGNVVFDAAPAVAEKVPRVVRAAIEKGFGLRVPVLVRLAKDFRAVAAGNPFLAAGADPDSLHVMFLADRPEKKAITALDADRSPPDAFVVKGREIYLACPNGLARTKLSNAWFDSKLGTTSTARNWRTVLKLVAMCDE